MHKRLAHRLDVCDVCQLETLVTRHNGHVLGGMTLMVEVFAAKFEVIIISLSVSKYVNRCHFKYFIFCLWKQ